MTGFVFGEPEAISLPSPFETGVARGSWNSCFPNQNQDFSKTFSIALYVRISGGARLSQASSFHLSSSFPLNQGDKVAGIELLVNYPAV
jgi:hypothetical protein